MLRLKHFLILAAQKAWLEICFFWTFSMGGWRGEGGKKVHGSKWDPASSGRLSKDLLALKAKVVVQELQQGKIVWKCCNGFTACWWPFWCCTLAVGLTAGAVVFFLFDTLPLACSNKQSCLLHPQVDWFYRHFLSCPEHLQWKKLPSKFSEI